MMKNKKIQLIYIICFFLVVSISNLYAQKYSTGMKFDDDAYNKVELKAKLLTRDYTVLPKSASLKQYCPNPGNQGQTGTCVGWSSAWAARTILEAKQKGWTDKTTITNNTFSPNFVYKNIKNPTDVDCQWGSFIHEAMELMRDKGVPKFKDFSQVCPTSIPSNIFTLASSFKIKGYARLFENNASNDFIIQATKKALASGNPVVIGMKCADSFFSAKDYWQPTENPNDNFGGHAMCVMGYDDNKHGGAFEVMNSWGEGWGNEGFIWIPYNTFADFTKYGYEAIAIPSSNPTNTTADLSGEIRFQLSSGGNMNAKYVSNASGLGYYKVQEPYTSGTKFRLYISNNEPAYVYAFGSDLTNEVFKIFPHKEGISAALNYKSNNIALPDEEHFIRMNETTGTDYLCVLYSKEPLDIEDIKAQVAEQSGTFAQKVNTVMKNKLVNTQNTTYSANQIKFSAVSKGKPVVAVIVETEHE